MQIAVLGTFLKDQIIDQNGAVTESKGGLFYSIEALRAVCSEKDEIYPISFVGKDFYADVVSYYQQDQRVNLKGLIPYRGQNNFVELRYLDDQHRQERSLNPMPSLKASHLEPFLETDLFIANFIAGWEMELTEFRTFTARFKGLKAMDVHSLTLERLPDGLRRLRKIENFDQWIEFVNIVQFNEKEYNSITNLSIDLFYKLFCFNQNKIVNLTLGKHGSWHLFQEGNAIKKIKIDPEMRVKVIDPTGCGDVFLASFVYFFATEHPIEKAAQWANILAAISGSKKGLPDVKELKNVFNQLVG